ncbi:tyrosine-type recombinase/integrase [Actinoplanes xinjiangensis]|uniref:tyrosine-type recombinase/integrase n=1 Tax=Actinoplanes xinjiangensis TaxID=512350 RepID=UPI0034163034
MGEVYKISRAEATPTFAHAVETYLAAHTLAGAWANGTATKYRQTLTALAAWLAASPVGADVAALDTPAGRAALTAAYTAAFGSSAPATRVRHLSTLRSACSWWRGAGWLISDPTAGWARPAVPVDTTRALTRDQVAGLWRLDVAVRDKTLWRMLYETAARAEEILTLEADDLDLPNKRARVVSKGGKTEWVFWQTGTALLLPRLIAGRTRGPLFLADRRPTRAVATNDLCPVTGRARLSYRRAAEIFEETTRPLADPVDRAQGWTLHQLRHSMLTHEAENGTSTPTLLARSRHTSVRSLARYARPGPEAVAAHVAATDPAARRRREPAR